jgi:hypothetical protein
LTGARVQRHRTDLARALIYPAAVVLCAAAAGCGDASSMSSSEIRAGLQQYLKQVEPVRLGVNRLLEGADPIIAAFHEHRNAGAAASKQMDRLERRFASFTVDVAAVEPRIPVLATLHAAYAHTYVLEDSYLSALATGLATGKLNDLPDTQDEQRAAIIDWRTGLAVLARKAHFSLPADLQVAGRGEIAPSPEGGS